MPFKNIFKILSAVVIIFTLGTFVGVLDNSQKSQVISGISPTVFSFLNRNETVAQAQEKLTELGLYDGNISGLFGFKTRDAIFLFQERVDIPRNGILDILTQEKLFNFSLEEEIEYVVIDNTDYGNSFLYEWVNYMYGNPGEIVKLQGFLTLAQPSPDNFSSVVEVYNPKSSIQESFYLNQEDEIFTVKNISENTLRKFNEQNVTAVGYFAEDKNSKQGKTFYVNYVTENDLLKDYPVVPYTEEGNQELKNWISKVYNEEGHYVDIPGHIVAVRDPMVYGKGGNMSNFVLTAYNEKFVIENISKNTLDEFIKQGVTVRGFLLDRKNEKGYYTIVINYLK